MDTEGPPERPGFQLQVSPEPESVHPSSGLGASPLHGALQGIRPGSRRFLQKGLGPLC